MASAPIPFTNVQSGYSIITQVVPSSEQNPSQTQNPLRKFLKGEPKALGTVQIMIGSLTILFGSVMVFHRVIFSVISGVIFWGSLFHIIAGSLAVSASNKLNVCVVKATMGLNIFSTIAALVAIIMFSIDFVIGYRYSSIGKDSPYGFCGVLLVFSLLQFAVSIAVSAFTCKATCTDQPTLNVINVVPSTAGGVPVVSSIPAYQTQPGVSTMGAVAMSAPPMENPPAYGVKGEAYN